MLDGAERPRPTPDLTGLILENAVDYAVFTLDRDGIITWWSAGGEKVTGYTADQAVGMDFAELFLEADRAAGVPARELERTLSVGRAEDTRWHIKRDGRRFWANGVSMRLEDGRGVVKVMRDETATKLAEDQRVLLLNELNHRIKNTLAIVQSIVEQTLRAAHVPGEVRARLAERLLALSQAHNVLVEQNWAGAELSAIVGRALAPHGEPSAGRFHVEGPPVRLSPQQAVSVSLVMNELMTNAVKYGALSAPEGRVRIEWNLAYWTHGERMLTLVWEESGGPPVSPPARRGFGSRLIERSFGRDSGGRAEIKFPKGGVCCVVELPLSSPAEIPMMTVSGDPSHAVVNEGGPRDGSVG